MKKSELVSLIKECINETVESNSTKKSIKDFPAAWQEMYNKVKQVVLSNGFHIENELFDATRGLSSNRSVDLWLSEKIYKTKESKDKLSKLKNDLNNTFIKLSGRSKLTCVVDVLVEGECYVHIFKLTEKESDFV